MLKPCQQLVRQLREALMTRGLHEDQVTVRISMGEDLPRVREFGTTRAGRSAMLWDKLNQVSPEQLPCYPILHEDIVIASLFCDLDVDAALNSGTLQHKLAIYADPFITVYRRADFQELLREGHDKDPQNHGRHWLFLTKDKPSTVLALFAIKNGPDGYQLEPLRKAI